MKKFVTQYYITYERDEKKGYVASAPAIPGCAVYGKTLKEAHRNISSAIEECLDVINEFNKERPRETIKPEIIRRFSFVKIPDYAKN